jgi:hypothetical protein
LKAALWSLDIPAPQVPAWLNQKADPPPLMTNFFRESKQALVHSEEPDREKGFVLTEHGQRWILSVVVKHMKVGFLS